MSKYQIIQNEQGKEAIFDTETGQQVSKWWGGIEAPGLLNGKSEYYIAKSKAQEAIFHISNPYKPISQWWQSISLEGIIKGESEYYIALTRDLEAIFHIDNPHKPVSRWWLYINVNGLVTGQSDYYVVSMSFVEQAIFHKDNPNEPVSPWVRRIEEDNAVRGESRYYIAEHHDRYALFDIDNPNTPISQWWKWIEASNVLTGKSTYYMVTNEHWDHAIFHVDDPNRPISKWYRHIYLMGILNNTTQYYSVLDDTNRDIQIYHPSDKTEPLYVLPNHNQETILLYFDKQGAIYLTNHYLMLYDAFTMQHDILTPLPKDMQQIIQKSRQFTSSYHIEVQLTNKLIFQYIDHNFLPIIITNKRSNKEHCYLFTVNGDYIGKFNCMKDITEYIDHQNSNNNFSCDMLRLY